MAHKYAQIAFTDTVRQVQIEQNSRAGYAGMDQGEDYNYLLSSAEAEFIAQRDSFYMASVGETLWPYLQHRGGPKGFMRVLDETTIGFADFRGNQQYISAGNFRTNDRVALFFMDYPNRPRLKIMGRIKLVPNTEWETLAKLEVGGYRTTVERGFLIKIEAFDWNCPQHIMPRFTEEELSQVVAPLIEENKILTEENTLLKRGSHRSQARTERKSLGQGKLPLTITAIRQLTPRVRAYELRHRDGLALPKVKAGAHIQIPVPLENGETSLRYYSICSNPAREDIYEIAVLREDEGLGGSFAIHHNFQLGQVLNCGLPENYFELHQDNRPAVLIAGGIGITPIKAMAQALKDRGGQLVIHYAGRSLDEMAFQHRLQREFGEHIRVYAADQNMRLDLAQALAEAPGNSVVYACGPQHLLDSLLAEAQKQGIHSDRIRFERFTAAQLEGAKEVNIKLAKSNKLIKVAKDQSILDAILEAGVSSAYSCKTGNCKTCAITVLEGEPLHLDNSLSAVEKKDQRLMCPCVSRSQEDYLVLDV